MRIRATKETALKYWIAALTRDFSMYRFFLLYGVRVAWFSRALEEKQAKRYTERPVALTGETLQAFDKRLYFEAVYGTYSQKRFKHPTSDVRQA
jgi:hypothetical protein